MALDPSLDVSRFEDYTLKADISGSPQSVTAEIIGINQDGGSEWTYYYDDTSASVTTTKTMTDANDDGEWLAENIRPDHIYPQTIYAPYNITWYNIPSETTIRRASYHILHFENSFVTEAGATFFIELYAEPNSTSNSSDLRVYLVAENKPLTFFNSDWRNSADVELIGAINRNDSFHHTHVDGKSSHYLFALTLNDDGTVGEKNLNISNDYWVVLYNISPNITRGWALKYHDSSLCDNTNGWYEGNQAGWTTTSLSGCPDVHTHTARRGVPSDGVQATITATYADSSIVTSTESFYFDPLPNLAPNETTFITPLAGGVYDGNEIQIEWNAANDPNNDDVTYNLYYYTDTVTTTITTSTALTTFAWDVSAIPDGSYGLKGEACDDAVTPLCTEFLLTENITLDKTDPVYSLSDINISSNNANSNLAKANDTITLTFTANGDISSTLNVEFYSGGEGINNTTSTSNVGNDWTITYDVSSSDTDGTIDYVITADNLDYEYSSSTLVTVDVTAPNTIVANPDAGDYSSPQSVNLSSSGSNQIRYTLDDSNPTCSTGAAYSSDINVSSPDTIKVIACDEAGNNTSSSFVYTFTYTLNYSAGSGGAITGSSTQSISYGNDGTAVTAVADNGYNFLQWSDGLTTNPRTDANITAEASYTASFTEIPQGGVFGAPAPPTVSVPPSFSGDIINYTVIDAYQLVVSETEDFRDASWEPYTKNYKYSNKKLYIKFRTEEGGVSGVYIVEGTEKVVEGSDGGNADCKFIRNLELGMIGEDVRQLQIYLNNNNFVLVKNGFGSLGNETNYFGRLTRNALIKFQKANGITETGILDETTRNNIGCDRDTKINNTDKNINKKYKFTKNLYFGMAEEDVKELQKYLNDNGFDLAKVGAGSLGNETNYFGPLTRNALIKFQKAYNILPTLGYFGPITRGVVNSDIFNL